MARPRPDKRLARTRRALRAALIDLLRTRDYDDLTVQDILQAADVGRSTFYAHFSGKDELLRFGLQSLGDEVRAAAGDAARAPDRRFAFLLPLLEHIEGHRELFRHLKGRGAEVHRQALDQILADLVRQAIGGPPGFDPLRELEVQFVKGALFATILWWVERNSSLGPGEVEAELHQLILGGRSFGA